MKYIIEHLEDEVWDWCILEYAHMSEVVGKKNLIFTNVPEEEHPKISHLGEVRKESVKQMDLDLKRCCLMEMITDEKLTPNDKNNFDYLIFGGILGDHPPQGRTKILHDLCTMRSLGREQMSTDTAVMVSHKIIGGTKIEDIQFQDTIELELNDGEDLILPYRYVVENGKPVLPKGLFEMLKNQEGL